MLEQIAVSILALSIIGPMVVLIWVITISLLVDFYKNGL